MEYLVDMVTIVPQGTSSLKVDELRAAEAVQAADLSKKGHLIRLWPPPLSLGEWRSMGLFQAEGEIEFTNSSSPFPFISE